MFQLFFIYFILLGEVLFYNSNFVSSVLLVIPFSNIVTDKKQILKDNKGKSGIYIFTNLKNDKKYIGSSDNLRRRFLQYYNLNYLIRSNYMRICRALLQHGHYNFNLSIIEYCKVEHLLIREGYYIDLLKPEYNILLEPTAGSTGFKHSPETREKMRNAQKGLKAGEKHHMYGQPRAEGAGRSSQVIEVTDVQTNKKTPFDSIHAAARALNINQASISMYFKQNQQKPYKGQYIFKKIN
jgi:hypothetical protein